MFSNKTSSKLIITAALGMVCMADALADYQPNDNYSMFVLSYQSSKFAEPVCIGAECHKGVAGPAAFFARQIVPNLALGVSGSYLQSDGNISSITSTYGSVFVQGIAGLGSSVDVGASLATLRTTLDLCESGTGTCITSSDSGTNMGVFGKVFLDNAKTVNVALGYNTIDFRTSPDRSVIALSMVAILAKHHRLAVSVDRARDSNGNAVSGGYGLGYSYLIYY